MRHLWFFLNDNTGNSYPESKPDIHHDIGYRHILKASFDDDTCALTVAYLTKKKKALHLVVVEGKVDQSQADHAAEWSESVMRAVYDGTTKSCVSSFQIINITKAFGIKRSRRFMVFVNPYGGRVRCLCDIYMTGTASHTSFEYAEESRYYIREKSRAYFEGCRLLIRGSLCVPSSIYTDYLTEQAFAVTTHQGQAQTVCQTLSLDFDAVITVSGDGLVHEILNGFAQHEDPITAFSMPVAPIPTGSGNGLCLNLLGREVYNN